MTATSRLWAHEQGTIFCAETGEIICGRDDEHGRDIYPETEDGDLIVAAHNMQVRLGFENPAAMEAAVEALIAWVGLVVQCMEKGEPYWYGDSLKEQGKAVRALFPEVK